LPYLSRINITGASRKNAITTKYVKAFGDMVRVWFKNGPSGLFTPDPNQYELAVQLQMLPTTAPSVPSVYELLEDCTKHGLNLVVKANYVPGSLTVDNEPSKV